MKQLIQINEGNEAPAEFLAEVRNGVVLSLTIAEDATQEERPVTIEHGNEAGESVLVWTWRETHVDNIRVVEYGALVTLLIRLKYSADAVEAAHCNAAAGQNADIDEINAWRAKVKAFARTIFPA